MTPKHFFILAATGIIFSCNTREPADHSNLPSGKDSTTKEVTQATHSNVAAFDHSDFNDLKNNKHYDRFLAGLLNLTTGEVVCTDPMYREFALPQSWKVNKGLYPVYLYIGLDDNFGGRVAYAELVVKEEVPAYWKLSLIPEKLLADSLAATANGLYPVENGLSCFADYETFKIYNQEMEDFYKSHKNGNYYNDILEQHFKKHKKVPKSSRGEDWINYEPVKASGNIIMFGSGMGDGLYPRYVGYDKEGNVVKFITDFMQVKESVE